MYRIEPFSPIISIPSQVYRSSMTTHPELRLNGFSFADLFDSAGLARLDQAFLAQLEKHNNSLHKQLIAYRAGDTISDSETTELLISCATILENFIASLFNIEEALAISQAQTTSFNPTSSFKKYFVLRRAKKELKPYRDIPPLR